MSLVGGFHCLLLPQFSRRVIGGQGVGDGTGGRGKRPAVAINGGGTAGEGALASEAPAWYERLIQGGGKVICVKE